MKNKYRYVEDLPLVLRVEDLMPILHIGRNKAYELANSGDIKIFHVGKQIRIHKDALVEYLNHGNLA